MTDAPGKDTIRERSSDLRGSDERPPELHEPFDPPTLRDSLGRGEPWTQWADSFDHSSGVSGLYFPNADLMLVDNRGHTHHNQQLHTALERDVFNPGDPGFDVAMPWAMNFRRIYRDGDVTDKTTGDLELPRSAGGLVQAWRLEGLQDNLELLQHGLDVLPEALWPVIWTARVLDLPGEVFVRFSHAPERYVAGQQGIRAEYSPPDRRQMASPVQRRFPLRLAYRELDFVGMLPDPRIDRTIEGMTGQE